MKFVWIGCISDHFCILKYDDTYIYIIFCSEQMTWQLHKFGCISDHFCVLQNTDICIYVSEQITWNLYELVACQIMFVSYKIMIYIYIFNFGINYMKFVWIGCMSGHFCSFKYHDVYIYLIFKPNDMKFVWIGCMSDHLCMVKNHDKKYIYIYIFNIRTTGNMPFLLIWVPPICLVSRFRGSITHAFPQMGVALISKAN